MENGSNLIMSQQIRTVQSLILENSSGSVYLSTDKYSRPGVVYWQLRRRASKSISDQTKHTEITLAEPNKV